MAIPHHLNVSTSIPLTWRHRFWHSTAKHHHEDELNCQQHSPTRTKQWSWAVAHRQPGYLLRTPGQQSQHTTTWLTKPPDSIPLPHPIVECVRTIYRINYMSNYMSITRPSSCHVMSVASHHTKASCPSLSHLVKLSGIQELASVLIFTESWLIMLRYLYNIIWYFRQLSASPLK